jgi:hypothetical protein
LPQQNPSNQTANLSSDVTKHLEKSLTGDDELLRKTVRIDVYAGNDEVAKADDANNFIQTNNSNFIYAKANKGVLATNAMNLRFLLRTTRLASLMPV